MSAIPTLPVTSAPAPVLSSTISPPLTPTTPDEKADSLFPSESDGQATPLPEERFVPSAEEDARVRRKLDFIVMPLLFIGFYVFQLERGNISNALTDGFLGHVGITQDQFNTGQSLLYLGIILLEIPSNYALQWFGPQIWISFQILAFGLVATLQSLQKGYAGFLASRIALGVAECGYIPGSLYIISTFYKREELAKRNAIFFVGSGLASATTGLLAYGMLPLGKSHPVLHGWQWMQIIEGCMAIFVSILFILFLPASPFNPRPMFLPIRYFNEKDQQILVARVLNDDKAKATSAKKITVKEVVSTLADWRKYPHLLLATAVISQTAAIGTYSPTLIRSFKFDSLTSNALSSVGGWIGLFMLVFMGWLSDKTRLRGPVVILAIAILLTWWITFQQVSTSDKRWLKYAFLILTHGFGQAYHPINATWLSLNCKTPQERSVGMAMFVMSANLGALIGAQLLRGDDAPLYRRGFRVCVGLTSFGLLVAILQHVQYRLSNRRIDRAAVRESENVEKGEAEKPLAFRYTI